MVMQRGEKKWKEAYVARGGKGEEEEKGKSYAQRQEGLQCKLTKR